MNLIVSIDVTVDDEIAFRRAAHDRALADELGGDEAASFLDNEERSLNDCAIMLFDPGKSPPGCSIEHSSAE